MKSLLRTRNHICSDFREDNVSEVAAYFLLKSLPLLSYSKKALLKSNDCVTSDAEVDSSVRRMRLPMC